MRVYLSQHYPDDANVQRVDETCLLDISPPLPSVVVNLTASVEDIVWQNLGAVITGVSVQWSLPLNTTISTDPTTLKYYDIGDNTSIIVITTHIRNFVQLDAIRYSKPVPLF